MRAAFSPDRLLPWVLRGAWVALVVVGGRAIDDAVADSSDSVRAVALWLGFAAWAVGMIAIAVPAVTSLTVARLVVPLGVPATIVAAAAGADTAAGVTALGLAGLATVLVMSAEVGQAFVQAAAYGDERRFLLRAPAPYLLAAILAWSVAAAGLIAGPLLLAHRSWIAGAVVTTVGLGVTVWGWPRWHRLSRRWFVIVPAGLVVHDHVALAETLMIRRQDIAGLRLAPAGTEALDLTGPAGGHAVEIAMRESVTAIVGAGAAVAPGTAVHVTACLVAPSRPGRALSAAARRRLRVG